MKKIFAAVALAALALAMLAGPAAAHDADAGVFQGTAAVGRAFTQVPDGNGGFRSSCDDEGNGVVDANTNGLYFPAPIGEASVFGVWTLKTSTQVGVLHGTGALQICGLLRPEPNTGLGAACGISQGHSGRGKIVSVGAAHPAATTYLRNVGWITSAGGTLPTNGDIITGPGGARIGTLIGVTQAQGGAACLETAGAKSFATVGASALLPL